MSNWIWPGILLCACVALVAASWWQRRQLKNVRLAVGAAQTKGVQEAQEDAFALSENAEATMAVLADGRGTGRVSGQVLSEYAVDTFVRMFDANAANNIDYFVQSTANIADHGIRNRINDGTGGASVAVAVVNAGTLHYSTCGNVQLGVRRGQEFVLLSAGDTAGEVAKQKFYEGKIEREKAVAFSSNGKVMRFLGIEGFDGMHCEQVTLQKGDTIAMMTQGVYDGIYWADIEAQLQTNEHVQQQADAIIREVEEGERNIFNGTVLLIEYLGN